ncbi:unnamed protein product [Adineta steineri]|uniref:Uncharacterized protein n=2 Tax=Adineta steineri TaxID=433720 RepID=A0A819XLE5_9BILA|nr:unnamed protein product [Adineta steineri]
MAFLLFKLIGKPLIHLFLRCGNKKTKDKHKQKNIHDTKKRQSSLVLSTIELRHLFRHYNQNQKKQRRQEKQKQKQEKNIVYSIPYISSDLPHRNDEIYWDRTQI